MFDRILVPTDLSQNSQRVFEPAAELARRFDAELLLAHITPPPIERVYYGDLGRSHAATLDDQIHKHVLGKLEQARRQLPEDVAVEFVHRVGDPSIQLVEIARERAARLIVIASHGHSEARRLLLGSVAEKLVRGAPCPVLTVRVDAW